MLTAVHTDRSGRVFLAHDRAPVAFDGAADVPLEDTIPLPPGSELVPLARGARALDRAGRARDLGAGRFSLAAVLPRGVLRTHHPAYAESATEPPLEPRAYAAVCADEAGELRVAAIALEGPHAQPPEPARAGASDRATRQVARCARANECAEARAILAGSGTGALPLAAAENAAPDPAVAIGAHCRARVRERAAFKATAEEIAALALSHFDAGGDEVVFGTACEGDPLASARQIEDAVTRVRATRADARIRIETSGSAPGALRRLARAGVGDVTVRLASARAATYERVHRPIAFRFADVRNSLTAARDAGMRVRLAVLVLPGLTDRATELEALADLADESGATVELRDLAADPRRALALVATQEPPLGVRALVARLAGV